MRQTGGVMESIPITRPFFGPEEEGAVLAVLRSRWVAQGERVAAFESAFARTVGAPYAVAVNSCTTALQLVFVAMGLRPGDEVVCPSLSFIATANAIVHAGGKPVFVDVDERTMNLDPELAAKAIGPRTRAILAVHQAGLPSDLDKLSELAESRGIALVEDAACALGASFAGVPVGRPHGLAACFSFHPRKIITTGEGGMIVTASEDLAEHVRRLRQHGMRSGGYDPTENLTEIGFNFRMTDVQAALGVIQLSRLESMRQRRRELATNYDRLLSGNDGIVTPVEPAGRTHSYQSYVVQIHASGDVNRDRVIDSLARSQIGARPGIMAAHLEGAYRGNSYSLPISERLAESTLALPLFHELQEAQQQRVVSTLFTALVS